LPPAAVRDGPQAGILADTMTGLRFMVATPLIRSVGLCVVAVVVIRVRPEPVPPGSPAP